MAARAGNNPASEDALQRMSPLVGIPALLAEFGVSTEKALQGLDLGPEVFADPETRIPYSLACRLVQNCVDATHCEHFGLLLGSRADHRVLGFAGKWMRNAPTLGASLTGFVGMQPSASRGGVVYLYSNDETVFFGYGIYARRTPGWQHLYPLVIAMAHNVVRTLTAGAARPTEVLISMREPADRRPYLDVFGVPVRFDQPLSALVMPKASMDIMIPGANPADYSTLQQQAARLMPPTENAWSDKVRRTLSISILENRPAMKDVAARLGVPERTLRRHLAREGATFQTILDGQRYASACDLLQTTDLSIGEIALASAYATHGAFDEAFRRWSGVSPSAWRANVGGGPKGE
jgi:AraC-like DNA-binding protein